MRVSILCPHCSRRYSVATKVIGKNVKCDCGKTFIADSANAVDPPDEPVVTFEEYVVQPPPSLTTIREVTKPRWWDLQPHDFLPRKGRYPVLTSVVASIAWLAEFQCRILGLVAVASAVIAPVAAIVTQSGAPVGIALTVVFYAAVSFIVYLLVIAALEFIKVFVDIERNTRLSATGSDRQD